MATIRDTLIEITQVQEEFDKVGNDSILVKELMNFTTVLYFDYLPHSILDRARNHKLPEINGLKKYYELFSQKDLLKEYIRFNNIGQFSVIWNAYEKYLREKYRELFNQPRFKIKELFTDLINEINPENKEKILEEFEVIRNTRNSLHDGGIYNENFSVFIGALHGQSYEFRPGEQVKPLRVMDVVQTIWSHYRIIENVDN